MKVFTHSVSCCSSPPLFFVYAPRSSSASSVSFVAVGLPSCVCAAQPDLDVVKLVASTKETAHLVDAEGKQHDPADLKGKTVLLYFSASCTYPGHSLFPISIRIFTSCDHVYATPHKKQTRNNDEQIRLFF